MSYEDWKEEIDSAPEAGGYDNWKKQIQEDTKPSYSKAAKDLAYKNYTDTTRKVLDTDPFHVPSDAPTGAGVPAFVKAAADQGKLMAPGTRVPQKIFTRETFEKYGEADKWLQSDAMRVNRSHPEKLEESFKRGKENFLTAQSYFDANMFGQGDTEKIYYNHQLEQAKDQLDPIEGGFIAEMGYGSARILPGMIEGGKQAMPEMVAGATLAVIAGQAGPQALTPIDEAITVPAGIALGFKTGSTYAWYKQGAGEMMLNMRDEGYDAGTSKIVASVAAIPYALIEQMQVGQLAPGVRAGANKIIQRSTVKLLGKVAKKYGKTLGAEVLEEVAQESIMIIAEDLAKFFSDQGIDVSKEELQDKAARLWGTMAESAKSMALLPVPGAGVDYHAGHKGMELAKKFENAGYNPDQALSMAGKLDMGMPPVLAHREVTYETIAKEHNENGSANISQQGARPIQSGYQVEVGEEEIVPHKDVTAGDLDTYAKNHADALSLPGRQISTWYDNETDQTYISTVHMAQTQAEAIELGMEYGNNIVQNLETGEIIPLETAEFSREMKLSEKKAADQIHSNIEIKKVAQKHGISDAEAQSKLDSAELRFRELTEKTETTEEEEQELAFLAENRRDTGALLNHDTKPIENERLSKKQIMDRVHNISDLLGFDQVKYRTFLEERTGKDSLTKMVPAQREQILMALEREAKERKLSLERMDITPAGELMAKTRELKQKPALIRRNRRSMTGLRKVAHDVISSLDRYFRNTDAVRQMCRMLDGYDDNGPFTRYIWRPTKNADVDANVNATAVLEATRDAFDKMGVDVGEMMTEVKDIGENDPTRLPVSERVYMKGFAAALTVIRNSADNMMAGAGKVADQKKAVLEELGLMEEHYESISDLVEENKESVPQLVKIKELMPAYSKAVKSFVKSPSEEGFSSLKELSDEISTLSTEYGEQISTERAKEITNTNRDEQIMAVNDKLTTSNRIGIYALAKNDKTRNHLLATFSEEEITAISESVERNEKEMLVAAEIAAYFKHGWMEFQAIAKACGMESVIKEDNYITAFIIDKDGLTTPNFLEGLSQQTGTKTKVPGEQHAIEREEGARREIETDIFMIYARAVRSIERFKVMAPVASKVGSILSYEGFSNSLNNVTYGHGSKLLNKWLQDSVRGAAAYDPSAMAPMLRCLRSKSINYVLGYKALTAAKQGVSLINAMAVDPMMIPSVMANLARAAKPSQYNEMYKSATGKSKMLLTRDWDRDLRNTFDKAQVKKMYQGKKLSPIAMRMCTYVDKHTCTIVWTSAYETAQAKGMNEEESLQFADGVIQETQPMGSAVDLPAFFRGNELETSLTVFQNQINKNGNYLRHNIIGELRAGKIGYGMASYRLMMSQIVPSLLLGMISRGRPPEDVEEIAKDIAFYMMSPFVFVGRWTYNIVSGDWSAGNSIIETPFVETKRLASALMADDVEAKKVMKYGARTIGAWSGGKIPLQAVQTAEGAWDLATDETDDWRELVWSKYAMRHPGDNNSGKSKKVKVKY